MNRRRVIEIMLKDFGFVGLLVGVPFGAYMLFLYYFIRLFPWPLSGQLVWLTAEIPIFVILSYVITDIYCDLREQEDEK